MLAYTAIVIYDNIIYHIMNNKRGYDIMIGGEFQRARY